MLTFFLSPRIGGVSNKCALKIQRNPNVYVHSYRETREYPVGGCWGRSAQIRSDQRLWEAVGTLAVTDSWLT